MQTIVPNKCNLPSLNANIMLGSLQQAMPLQLNFPTPLLSRMCIDLLSDDIVTSHSKRLAGASLAALLPRLIIIFNRRNGAPNAKKWSLLGGPAASSRWLPPASA